MKEILPASLQEKKNLEIKVWQTGNVGFGKAVFWEAKKAEKFETLPSGSCFYFM